MFEFEIRQERDLDVVCGGLSLKYSVLQWNWKTFMSMY